MLRILAIIFGIVLAAVGGVIVYRAYFEPAAAVIISERGVREIPDTFRMIEGLAALIVGAAIAFTAARRKTK